MPKTTFKNSHYINISAKFCCFIIANFCLPAGHIYHVWSAKNELYIQPQTRLLASVKFTNFSIKQLARLRFRWIWVDSKYLINESDKTR